ncbi:hypothetical protein HYU23_03555 [Candidatus Woesearchaeota archaeon]|nr:hypothetical protein [Candidatus Woesearchaeota archaeon]
MVLEQGFNLQESIDFLVSSGVYDILLPFLLVFAIVFAILEKTKILGEEKTNINAIVAGVVGLLLVVQKGIVATLNLFLPRVSMIIIVTLMGLLVISMVAGKEFKGLRGTTLGIAVVVIIFAVIISLTSPPTGYGTPWLTSYDQQVLLSVGLPLLILVLVIWLVTASPKKEKGKGFLKTLAKEAMGEE